MLHLRTGRTQAWLAVLACMLAVLACGDGGSESSGGSRATTTTAGSPPTSAASTTTESGGTTDDARPADATFDCAEQTGGDDGSWHLVRVDEAQHAGYDRVVFEFRNTEPTQGGVPRYKVRLRDPPYMEDPSDEPLDVPGTTAIDVSFLNASGVDLTGMEPAVVYTGPSEIVTDRAPLTSVVAAGDFENTMSWLLGLDVRHCFDVLTLDDPPRVVVDIEH